MNLLNDDTTLRLRGDFAEATAEFVIAERAFNLASTKKRELQVQLIHRMYRLQPGKTVLWGNDRKMKKFVFEKLDGHSYASVSNWTPDRAIEEEGEHGRRWGRPWILGYQLKKDGTPGTQLRSLYGDWRHLDEVE